MSFSGILFGLVASALLLSLPRRWAPLPLLAGACYMTLGQGIEIGPFHFQLIRLLILVGLIRVAFRNERPAGGFCGMDWVMICWGVWALCSSAFHKNSGAALVNHSGMMFNTLGVYFLIRCFCHGAEEVASLVKMTAIMLVPVALEMLGEQLAHRNLFSIFGGVDEEPEIRNGRVRAQGPFFHAILAGTVGAVCAPMMVGIWRSHPRAAKVGLAACTLMVIASASSGPLMSLIIGGGAVFLWRWRHLTKQMRITGIVLFILLQTVMNAPVYYLLSRIDLVGGSTGYHRARLIQSAYEDLSSWWLAGTDYTRDWMPYGVPWSEDHADITNNYLAQGVKGGLPLMLLFIWVLWKGFRYVGQGIRIRENGQSEHQFLIWTLGASLGAHAVTCTSVAYFDQSFVFLYMTLAMSASQWTVGLREVSQSQAADVMDMESENGAVPVTEEGNSDPAIRVAG